jgi:hypothetical protein
MELLLIFGMNMEEILTLATLLVSLVVSIIWINVKLSELSNKVKLIENNLVRDESLVVETAKILRETTMETAKLLSETTINTAKLLKETTEKINQFEINKLKKMDNKIDAMIETINEIQINCAKNH